jgi:PAS domain S-box-containing protein
MATDDDEVEKQKYTDLESVSKSVASGLTIISKDYHVIWANSYLQPVIQRYGGPDKKCYQIFNHLTSVCPDCGVKKIFEQNAPLDVHEYKTITEKGQTLWVELRATPLKDRKGVVTAALELVVPITERKKAEEDALFLASIVQNSDDAIIGKTLAGIITSWNNAAEKMYGYKSTEVVGKSIQILVPHEHQGEILDIINKIKFGKQIKNYHVKRIRKDGTEIDVALTVSPIRNKVGEIIGASSIARDITELKKAEAKLSVAQEKLRVVGKLTRHDVRNNLSSINAITYLLKKRLSSDPEVAKYLASIDSAVAVSSRIFEFSELYEKIGAEEQVDIDVKNCFDEAVALIPNLGHVRVFNESDGLTVVADSLLRQIFYNLIDNSLKHGKTVTQIRLYYKKKGNPTKLYYDDDGVGVSVENKPKLFSEGFSTGDGTGLGLSMIKKIIEVYKWSIKEIGLPGKGVVFEITIPIHGNSDT